LATKEQESLKGIGLKEPTNIRKFATIRSDVVKKVTKGDFIEFKSFSKDYFEVYESNKIIGYLHKKHVELINDEQEDFRGIARKDKTNIRQYASTDSNIVKKYPKGAFIHFKSLSENWFEAFE